MAKRNEPVTAVEVQRLLDKELKDICPYDNPSQISAYQLGFLQAHMGKLMSEENDLLLEFKAILAQYKS